MAGPSPSASIGSSAKNTCTLYADAELPPFLPDQPLGNELGDRGARGLALELDVARQRGLLGQAGADRTLQAVEFRRTGE